MKELISFKNPKLVKEILEKLKRFNNEDITIMEVCGTHTMSILKSGLKELLPQNIKLISGPGCPVCVTPQEYIDMAIELCKKENVIITTFGDLVRVPGTHSSLQKEKALGRDIRVVFSPLDSLEIAKSNLDKEVVFLGVGFETTAPIIALTVYNAKEKGIDNLSILNSLKTMPNVMKSLVSNKELKVDGFICPGHVAAVIGAEAFENLSIEEKLPLVIAGFEPLDIISAIYRLVEMKANGESKLENLYTRIVKNKGNEKALNILNTVFQLSDSQWRGFGIIEGTGFKFKENYKNYDTKNKFNINIVNSQINKGCICGEILRGVKNPYDCKLYGKVCTPVTPIGACMVSEEGTCAAYYKYN
ncbi:hydrogenase formation protein HypD [Clostridium disporicum]|uniref:Hydrogenase expression/formation protein HypD n=1 Tax=Clostridium disporicum TaxID=84024 RepID=A0A173XFW4_9CLOT|nr:hydrogenase formation protein HypD [Clostridium disporicum]CUN50742.1 hydrogenase expression/formation protein HypD [Clostridium disporicum]